MSQKLRLKLPVINAGIVLAFFLALIVGLYCLWEINIIRHTDFLAQKSNALFLDSSRESDMLELLLTVLAGVGIFCSLLSFGASLFLTNRAMVPIQNAWQQQKYFLADAFHELRAPLTDIQTSLDVVRCYPEETVASQGKWLKNIQEETALMAKTIDSLLFLARGDSRGQPLIMRLFPIRETVIQAVASFEPVAAAKGVRLEVSAQAAVGDCYGDETLVRQLIGILLDNAIRYTPSGNKVMVYLSQANAKIILSVADTGEGIEPQHLTRLFDRFYRANKSRNDGGSGLGLAIARWIATSHGGTITVDSRPSEGSVFKVELSAGK